MNKCPSCNCVIDDDADCPCCAGRDALGEPRGCPKGSHGDACLHTSVKPEVCDQTLGVACTDCGELLHVCWQDDHIPESLWNRAAPAWPKDAVPAAQSRDNVCAICEEEIAPRP